MLGSKAVRKFREASREVAQEIDATPSEQRVLLALEGQDFLTPMELSRRLDVDKSVISRGLSSLHQKGLVSFRPQRQDGRSKEVHLTAKGRREAERIERADDRRVHADLDHLPPEEAAAVMRGMEIYAAALLRTRRERRRRPRKS